MWAAKWFLASLFTSRNVIQNAMNQITLRFSSTSNEGSISRVEAIKKNLNVLNRKPIIILLSFSTVFYIALFVYRRIRSGRKEQQMPTTRQILPFLLLSSLPFIWVFLLANHSYIHFHFTYRVFSVTVFAVLCGFSVLSVHDDTGKNQEHAGMDE